MMIPGTYYVGDLCYVMFQQWDKLCDIILNDDEDDIKQGEFVLDNVPFAIYNTKNGDGVYLDENQSQYAVDSGSIGCVSIEHINQEDINRASKYSKIVTFGHAFTTKNIDGVIHIGHIVIDTTQ